MNESPRSKDKRPVVFVSYSHEGKQHSNRVLALAKRLREKGGCESRLDKYDDNKVSNWPRWMRIQIDEADYILMVFTRTYRRRFDGNEAENVGRGVTWEGAIITNSLYAAAANPAVALKFIPVVFTEKGLIHVPRDIFSGTTYVLNGASDGWDRLVNRIWNKPSVQPPPVGGSPALTSRKSRSSGTPPVQTPSPLPSYPPHRSLSVLFVGAQRGTGLDLQGQLKRTKESIAKAKFGQSVGLTGVFNITLDQMLVELNNRSPDVLHLSGKQEGGNVKMHNARGKLTPICAERLAEILASYQKSLRLVILDTCFSLPQARTIVKKVDMAIGVASAIADPVAIDFFAMFYNAVASGVSIKHAHELAVHLELAKLEGDRKYRREIESILEEPFDARQHLPQLVSHRGIRTDRVFLVK